MSINLQKGGSINLTKSAPTTTVFKIGLGWDASNGGQTMDLDASAFMLNANGKFHDPLHFVFYNNLHSPEAAPAIQHSGDNLTGAAEGDDETITVTVPNIPPEIAEISFIISIYDAVAKGQHFGMVKNAFARIYDAGTGKELAKFNLTDECNGATSVQMGSLMRRAGDTWSFEAVGVGSAAGLQDYINQYQE